MFSTKFIARTIEYTDFNRSVPAPMFRRTFEVTEAVQTASMTLCGLGFYELWLNGYHLTKGYLAPYISNPDDILYYDCYDVAQYLQPGKNVIAVMLGNGYQNNPGGIIWDFQKIRFRSAPKLALAFEMNGQVSFEADERFLCDASPIYFDDYRVGEKYDARLEQPGWQTVDFDDSRWQSVIPAHAPAGECRLCEAEPIAVRQELMAKEIRYTSIGEYNVKGHRLCPDLPCEGLEAVKEGWLYDFGLNAAGLCKLRIKGKPGQKIILQFGETTMPDGRVDLRGTTFMQLPWSQRDTYICKGEGVEEWTPSFTFHGFRYCLVIGLEEEQATPDLLTYLVMNSDLPTKGGFSSSDETLNAIQAAARNSDLSNFYYFPMDCPHREKNGWTGDAMLSCEQMMLNFGAENSLKEWLHNIRKVQREDGALPGIIPTGGWGMGTAGPAWDGVIAELPWNIWRFTGDTEVIRQNAPTMMRYVDHILSRCDEEGNVYFGCLGDWCPTACKGANGHKTPKEVTDALVTMDILRKMAKMLRAVKMIMQADYVQRVYDRIRAAARKSLVDWNRMTVLGNCQSCQAMALYYDLFEPGEQPEAFRMLLKMIEQRDGLMDVGVLGVRVLFRVLSRFGRTDLAYSMITTPRYPSYAWMVQQGYGALWEAIVPMDKEPMSRNHHFWGDVSGWMMEHVAGLCINPDGGNVKHVVIRPRIIDALDHAEAWHEMPYGKVSVSWKREGEDVLLTVEVPEGCSGRIELEVEWQFADGRPSHPLQSGQYRLLSAEKNDERYFPE